MRIDEVPELMDWLGKEFNNLSLDDQAKIINATVEYVKALEPIYMKNIVMDEKATFLFKL